MFESFFNFLDCNQVVWLLFILIFGSDNNAVSAGTNWVDNFVVFGELKARPQNFVSFSARASWWIIRTECLDFRLVS